MPSSLNLIWHLYWHNFVPKDKEDRLKLVWIFAEPIGQMAVLLLVFSMISRSPAYGRSFALFFLTGIGMLTLFKGSSQLVMGAIKQLNNAGRLPAVGMFHEAIARILFMLTVAVIYVSALLWGVHVFQGVRTLPHHWPEVVTAFALCALLAFGVGLLRGYCALFIPFIERIYVILARALLFVSGVFYVTSFMPPQLRDILRWNPVLQVVELLRSGVYREYPTIVLDVGYLFGVSLGAVALGAALLWARRSEVLG